MNYFDNLNLKGNITVLGVAENSDFVKTLKSVAGDGCTVNAPDKPIDGHFKVHSAEEIAGYREKGIVFGVVDIGILEKRVCDVINGVEDFCEINSLFEDELIYPMTVARVVYNREKYDVLYIDGVNSENKRYLARDIAKCFAHPLVSAANAFFECDAVGADAIRKSAELNGKSGMGIRIINTDSNYAETLVKW